MEMRKVRKELDQPVSPTTLSGLLKHLISATKNQDMIF